MLITKIFVFTRRQTDLLDPNISNVLTKSIDISDFKWIGLVFLTAWTYWFVSRGQTIIEQMWNRKL